MSLLTVITILCIIISVFVVLYNFFLNTRIYVFSSTCGIKIMLQRNLQNDIIKGKIMKDKKRMSVKLEIFLIFICFLSLFMINKQALSKTTTIRIEKGKTYQLKIKKGSKIKCSNKKIAKIMKNGKIKGLKKGKCKIEVKNGKRTMKYTIRVNSVKKNRETPVSTASPAPIANPTERPNPVDGGSIYVKDLTVSSIDRKDDNTSVVCLAVDMQTTYFDKDKVKCVKFDYPNDKLSDIKSGDKISIGFNTFNVTHEIENGTDTIKGNVLIIQLN